MLATSHCVLAFNQSTQKNFEFTVRVKFFKWDAQMSVLVYRWIRPSQLINQVCAAIRRNRLQAVTLALRAKNLLQAVAHAESRKRERSSRRERSKERHRRDDRHTTRRDDYGSDSAEARMPVLNRHGSQSPRYRTNQVSLSDPTPSTCTSRHDVDALLARIAQLERSQRSPAYSFTDGDIDPQLSSTLKDFDGIEDGEFVSRSPCVGSSCSIRKYLPVRSTVSRLWLWADHAVHAHSNYRLPTTVFC